MSTFNKLNLEKYPEKIPSNEDKFVEKINSLELFIYNKILYTYKNTCSITDNNEIDVRWICNKNGERIIKFPCNKKGYTNDFVSCKDENDKNGFEKFRENIRKCTKNKNFVIIPVGFKNQFQECGGELWKLYHKVNDLLKEDKKNLSKKYTDSILKQNKTDEQKLEKISLKKMYDKIVREKEEIEKKINKMNADHRNIVVYNVKQNEYFRIEPNGAHVVDVKLWYEIEKFDEEFKKKMKKINEDINAVKLIDSCPNFGPQSKGGQSTCILWSFFILEHILLNPKMNVKTIQEQIMKEYDDQNKLRCIISKYLSYIKEEYKEKQEQKQEQREKEWADYLAKKKAERAKRMRMKEQKRHRKYQQAMKKKKDATEKAFQAKNKVRKHQGIIQTGGNTGRLRKGYRYSGKKLKSGLPQIIKIKKKKIKR